MSSAQGHAKDNVSQIAREQDAADQNTDEFLQSQPERQLFIVFFALLQMDKRPDLVIKDNQAETLLPVVKEAMLSGELSQAMRKVLESTLNVEQQIFFEEIQTQMRNRALNRKPGPPAGSTMTEEDRKVLMEDLKQRRLTESHSDDPKDSSFDPTPLPELPMDKNVEQQLVELLESKKWNTLTK
jgi:hypothetical protein